MNTINADYIYDAGNAAEAAYEGKTYICNAFSLQMLANASTHNIHIDEINEDMFNIMKKDAISAVGHPDTARVLGVECNRMNVKLGKNDVLLVAQLVGGRLPEGVTTLPEGFSFKYYHISYIDFYDE